jgi:hypothetical protein
LDGVAPQFPYTSPLSNSRSRTAPTLSVRLFQADHLKSVNFLDPSSRAARVFSAAAAILLSAIAPSGSASENLITHASTTHHYGQTGIGSLGIDGNDFSAQEGSQSAPTPPTSVIINSEHRFPVPVQISSIRVHATADAEFGGLALAEQSRAIWLMTKVGVEYTLDGTEWLDLDGAVHIQKSRYRDFLDHEDEDGDGDPNNEEAGENTPFIEPFSNVHSLVNGTFEVNLTDVLGVRVIAKSRSHGDFPTNVVSKAAIYEIAAFGSVGPANRPPNAAQDYAFSYPAGVLIDVLDNDTDHEGSPLTLVSIGSATNGTAEIVGQKILFIPAGPLKLNEGSLTYVVSDGEDSSTGTVTVFDPPDFGKRYAGTLHKSGPAAEPVGIANILFAAEGAATGAVTRLRARFPFTGGIGHESPAFFSARVNRTTNVPLRVSAGPRDAAGNPTITFVIGSPDATQRWAGVASQSPYNRLNPSPYVGRFTVAADAGENAPVPSVGGVFNLLASRLGFVNVIGKAGNGRGFRVASLVLHGDRVPFYAALSSAANPPSLSGGFDLSVAGSQHVNGSARWISPAGADPRLPTGLDKAFPCIGARYTHAGTPSSMLAFNADGLAKLAYTQLSSSPDTELMRPFDVARVIPGPEPLANLKTYLGNAMFSGKLLLDPTKPRRSFQGVCIQGPGLNYGVGFVIDSNQIGRVKLVPEP